jgi:hypothetical protein
MRAELLFEFVCVLVVLPFISTGQLLFEFVSVLVMLPLVRAELLFAQSLARDPAENGAKRAANGGPDHWRRDPRYAPEDRGGAPHKVPDASKESPTKELIRFELSFELLGALVVLPFELALMVLKLAQPLEFSLELLFQLALICRHLRRPSLSEAKTSLNRARGAR